MDFFECKNQMEKFLRQKCADLLQPFAGALELMPGESITEGQQLAVEQWLSIIDQASAMGVYAIRLTGGEPLAYPEFKQIYAHLCEKGITVSLDTNGLLLNEEYLIFLKKYGCREINLSLLGADNEIYEKLFGIKDGFDRMTGLLNLLKAYRMPVNIMVNLNQLNIGQVDQMNRLAESFHYPVRFSSYMYLKTGKAIPSQIQYRLAPEKAAQAAIQCFLLANPQADYLASCRYTLSKLANPTRYSNLNEGFSCYAAKSDFWITWDGEMLPCGMFRDENLYYSLMEHSFADCWSMMTEAANSRDCKCAECITCSKRDLCQVCPAACYTETGSMNEKPEYLCKMAEETVRICREAIEESTSEKPLVSIIVPVYNVEKYISACVESFLKQNFTAWEMILVDDGSSDGSGALCDQYAAQDNRIRVLHQANKGVSAARNKGIEIAQAEYIIFFDSDDFVEPDFCGTLYHKIKEREDALITVNTWCGTDDNLRQFAIGADYEDPDHITLAEAQSNVLFAYVWNKIYVRKKLMEYHIRYEVGCSYGEDVQFNEAYMKYCKDAAFIREPLCTHLFHKDGLADKGLTRQGFYEGKMNLEVHGIFKKSQ